VAKTALSGLKSLQTLDLGNTKITDAGLNDLKQIKKLRRGFAWRTGHFLAFSKALVRNAR
jgi:hypothetical protein